MATSGFASMSPGGSVRDRLVTTLFVAAMLHGIVIAGISFSDAARNSRPAGLDVLIVSDEVPDVERNDSAQYLAQRSQLGGGSTRAKLPPRSPASLPDSPQVDGDPHGTTLAQRAGSARETDSPVLTTTAQQPRIRWIGENGDVAVSGAMPTLLDAHRSLGSTGHDDTGQPQLSGPDRKELWITPNTRASILAPWLDAWRSKVERLGTLNYPAAAHEQRLHDNPVVEVSIGNDGRLLSAVISRSSGYPAVDQAALDILKLASPFDPFPPEVQQSYQLLRFAYEWQFEGAAASGASLSVPNPP